LSRIQAANVGNKEGLSARQPLPRQALGEAVQRHYLHFFRTEWEAYEQAVTDWDRKRYFERI